MGANIFFSCAKQHVSCCGELSTFLEHICYFLLFNSISACWWKEIPILTTCATKPDRPPPLGGPSTVRGRIVRRLTRTSGKRKKGVRTSVPGVFGPRSRHQPGPKTQGPDVRTQCLEYPSKYPEYSYLMTRCPNTISGYIPGVSGQEKNKSFYGTMECVCVFERKKYIFLIHLIN